MFNRIQIPYLVVPKSAKNAIVTLFISQHNKLILKALRMDDWNLENQTKQWPSIVKFILHHAMRIQWHQMNYTYHWGIILLNFLSPDAYSS